MQLVYFSETFSWYKVAKTSEIHKLLTNLPLLLLFIDLFLTYNVLIKHGSEFLISSILSPNKSKHLSTSTRSINGSPYSQTLSCNFFFPPLFWPSHKIESVWIFINFMHVHFFGVAFIFKNFFCSWNSLNICQRHRDKKNSSRFVACEVLNCIWYFCIPEAALTSVFLLLFQQSIQKDQCITKVVKQSWLFSIKRN